MQSMEIDHRFDDYFKEMADLTTETASYQKQVETLKILIAEKIQFLMAFGLDQKQIATGLRKFMNKKKEDNMSSRPMKDERLIGQPLGNANEEATKVLVGSGESNNQSVKIVTGSSGF